MELKPQAVNNPQPKRTGKSVPATTQEHMESEKEILKGGLQC
jgi:hypothetical protein